MAKAGMERFLSGLEAVVGGKKDAISLEDAISAGWRLRSFPGCFDACNSCFSHLLPF